MFKGVPRVFKPEKQVDLGLLLNYVLQAEEPMNVKSKYRHYLLGTALKLRKVTAV